MMQRRSFLQATLAFTAAVHHLRSVEAATPASPVAQVERVEGQAFGLIAGVAKPLVAGQRLPLFTDVFTEGSGVIRLRLLSSGALLIIGHRSRLRLDHAHLEAHPVRKMVAQVEQLTLRLMQGALRYLSQQRIQTTQHRDVVVSLPTATVGIRGTDFYTESENQQDIVCLFDGQVDVTQADGKVFQLRERFDFYLAKHDGSRQEQTLAEPKQVTRWKSRFYPLGLSGDPPPDGGGVTY